MEEPEVQKIRDQLLLDYGDTVFAKIPPKSRPVRGPFGEAMIEIRPGATPVKQRPYHFHGERRDALCRIVEQLGEQVGGQNWWPRWWPN